MVVSLCTDSDKKAIQKYLKDVLPGETLHFPTLVDGYKTFKAFRSRGYPSNLIVDKEGVVRFFHWNLGEWNLNQFKTEIEALAAE
jgi:hypothetical protein